MQPASHRVSASLAERLGQLLAAETALSERLHALIGREKLLMEQPLHPDLDELLQHKLNLLQELQDTSQQRQQLMQEHGFAAGPAGVAACSAALPALQPVFRRLEGLARDCHEANQRLGLLLNRKSGFFARLLGSLADGGQPPGLYQPDGRRDPGNLKLRHRLSV